MDIIAHDNIIEKLRNKVPPVSITEVEEAWFLFEGETIEDNRLKNRTNPPTEWFISETCDGRLLKVVFIPYEEKGYAVLRTAYDPDDKEVEYYEKNC